MKICTLCGKEHDKKGRAKYCHECGAATWKAQCKRWNKLNLNNHRRAHKEQYKNYKLKAFYNITIDDYKKLSESQNNLCAICQKEEKALDKRSGKPRQLAVDHCHDTGKVRGLLCINCNMMLGKINDNKELLRRAIEYLETNEKGINEGESKQGKNWTETH